jgi:hypothetical protein
VVTVPPDPKIDITALKPVITYTGYSLSGVNISETGGPNTVTAEGTEDFSSAQTYTVTAENGSTRKYTATVFVSDRMNDSKQITGFYFLFPNARGEEGAVGIINETAKTIAVTVPYGTDLRSLAPAVYHTGMSISPISGEPKDFRNSGANPVPYTVTARDGTKQTYMVSVFIDANNAREITAFNFKEFTGSTVAIGSSPGADGSLPIVITVPALTDIAKLTPVVTHTGASITGGGIPAGGPGTVTGSSPTDFTGPVPYTVSAENGETQTYTVTVIKTADPALGMGSNLASIDGFYFNNPMAAGVIDQNARTITVTVPYGTNLANLAPTIYFTGNGVAKGTALVDTPPTSMTVGSSTVAKPFMSSPASIAADFSSPVQYTVTPLSLDAANAKTYTVTVNSGPAPPASSVREITFFSFMGVDDVDTTAAISTVPDASGDYPAEVIIPSPPPNTPINDYLRSLKPVILYKGVSISGAGNLSSGNPYPTAPEITGVVASNPVDFTTPQPYTVTAANGQTKNYVVTVLAEDNNVKKITGFYFTEPLAVGVIDEDAKTIDVTVPSGTNLSALRPTVYYTGASLSPVSGKPNSFNPSAVYTVTARNGTTQPYTVRVHAKAAGTKEITAISFPGTAVLDTVIGAIPGPDGKIPIFVTVSGGTNPASLRADITHTGKSISPGSGSVLNFQNPVSYRVTAEDGSTKDYSVSVHRSISDAKIITGFTFNSVPLGNNTTTAAVGQIDQKLHTIEVVVPRSAVRSSLAPTLTYIGASITPPGGTAQTANPYTDSPRNFTGSQVYKVTATDGSAQDYTVTVDFEEQNTNVSVTFQGITDPALLSTSFSQSAGIVSLVLTVSPSYGAPYEWYLDGRRLNVSGTEPRLDLSTAGLQPGQHEVVVVVTKTAGVAAGYPTHYTNKVYFLVQE